MIKWIAENYTWAFSGLLVPLIYLAVNHMKKPTTSSSPIINNQSTPNIIIENNQYNSAEPHLGEREAVVSTAAPRSEKEVKDQTRILFIDDDTRFKVVKILKSWGWVHTTSVKDISSLTENTVTNADILFIDIQGVGVQMGFKDEGLGLANAIKDRYPEKKVVIYSAEPKGERFHKALRKADGSLEKNADPYEFEQIVNDLTGLSQ